MSSVKRVWYSYNSEIKELPYTLGIFSYEDGKDVVSLNKSFASREEFEEAILGVIPVLEEQGDKVGDSTEISRASNLRAIGVA